MPNPFPGARRCFVWLFSPLAFLVLTCSAAETVTVELTDGRVVTGVVDGHTDLLRLWLRRDEADVELLSGFAWEQVAQGRIDGRTINRAELRGWSEEKKQSGRKFLDLIATSPRDEKRAVRPDAASVVLPVRALVIEACLAQWDGDAQPDGLRIFVAPVDARGDIVPVDGQIDFTLVVENEKLNGGQNGSLRPEFRELERGTFIVHCGHFTRGPAVYELPFSQRHPDFDVNIATQALVHARLGVPGRGVFEASDCQVVLREHSRFRDQLQYYTPRRYLPLESGGQPNP